jgi:hypothetical protein
MSDPNEVFLTLPADPARLPLARTVAVSCGALAGFHLDRIDDLRQCTQEALALLLDTCPGDEVDLAFHVHGGRLEVLASLACQDADATPDSLSFAWLLLTELADDASIHHDRERLVLRFVMETHESRPLSAGDAT